MPSDALNIDPQFLGALSTVIDPCSSATGAPLSVVDLGLVKRAEWVGDDRVAVHLRLTSPLCWNAAPMMDAIEQAIRARCDARHVVCTADDGLEWEPEMIAPEARRRLQVLRPVPRRRGDD